jgi:uncharacterized protein YggU (UPF0235/DUF167 family)
MSPDWLQFQASESRLTLQIHAQPNAKTTGAAGLHGDALKVRIAARRHTPEGRAHVTAQNR